MQFKSEKARVDHPLASRFPAIIWDTFFASDFSEFHMQLMTVSLPELQAQQASLAAFSTAEKTKVVMCFIYRSPPMENDDLLTLVMSLNLTSADFLYISSLTGCSILLHRFLETEQVSTTCLMAFSDATKNGHFEIMQTLLNRASKALATKMIAAYNFEAFRIAAANGQLALMQTILSLSSPEIVTTKILPACTHAAFRMASVNGHLHILRLLISLDPSCTPKVIELFSFECFRMAASNGHFEVVQELIRLVPTNRLQSMISANDFHAFTAAAQGGHLKIVQTLLRLCEKEKLAHMIEAQCFTAFRGAAQAGSLEIMEAIMAVSSPECTQNMIATNAFSIFSKVATSGHLPVINALLTLVDPAKKQEMITKNVVSAFIGAASEGHLHVMEALMALAPSLIPDMISGKNFSAFAWAAMFKKDDVARFLLTFPEVLKYANEKASSHPEYQRYIANKPSEKRSEQPFVPQPPCIHLGPIAAVTTHQPLEQPSHTGL